MKSRFLLTPILLLALAACQPPSNNDKGSDTGDGASTSSSDARLNKAKAKALASGASAGNVTLEKIFEGPDGLVGLIVKNKAGGTEIAWATENLEYLLPIAYDDKGQPFNEKALVEQKVYLPIEEFSKEILAGKTFIVGEAGPVITAFMDPNCGYCNRFYKDVIPLVKQGKVRVRFVMVGFLREDSIPKAAEILAAKDPAKALERDEQNFGKKAPEPKFTPEAQAQVESNTQMMSKVGQVSTPMLVICKKGFAEPVIERGQPQDIKGFVEALDTESKHALCSGK